MLATDGADDKREPTTISLLFKRVPSSEWPRFNNLSFARWIFSQAEHYLDKEENH